MVICHSLDLGGPQKSPTESDQFRTCRGRPQFTVEDGDIKIADNSASEPRPAIRSLRQLDDNHLGLATLNVDLSRDECCSNGAEEHFLLFGKLCVTQIVPKEVRECMGKDYR